MLSAATAPSIRRNASNINRNAKEFSKFWQNGGNFQVGYGPMTFAMG